jgi:RNA polymerase sigma factor (sigma-70 family)
MPSQRLGLVLEQIRKVIGLRDALATPDAGLLERFATQRDEAAFAEIMRRHGPMVLGVCRRVLSDAHEIDDAFQATFLVLVRRAASIGRRELLANWLFGVAHRTALKARGQAARRGPPCEVRDMPTSEYEQPPLWADLKPHLDEELSRLPERYRRPVVLCYLQRKTLDEAAAELGWSRGSVKGRLERARELLRRRLSRRGATLSATALGTILTEAPLSAAVPASLFDSTQRAALLFATGSAAGAVAPQVIFLTKGVLRAMLLSRLSTLMYVLLVSVVVVGVAVRLGSGAGADTGRDSAPDARLATDPVDAPKKAEDAPKKSTPVVKDSLEVTIVPAKRVFAAREVPAFDFTYANTTVPIPKTFQAFMLYDVGFEVHSWSCVDADGKTWTAGPYEYAARPAPRIEGIEAGKSLLQKQTLRGPFSGGGARGEALPPGRYRVSAKLIFRKPDKQLPPTGARLWTGELVTGSVDIEIAGK